MSRLVAVVLSSWLLGQAAPGASPGAPAASGTVAFSDPASAPRLERSKHKIDFFRLANQFETQQNVGYCGPASATIVLNALRFDNPAVAKPRDEALFPAEYRDKLPSGLDPVFRRYTQGTFFDPQTESVKPKRRFFGEPKAPGARPSPGIELRELGDVLRAHGLDVQIRVADASLTDQAIRAELVENLGRAGDYVIVNFLRSALGQKGSGHMSPLGAYDQASDSFLVLDTNPQNEPWAWVSTTRLIAAMRTKDVDENRGYLLVKEGAGAAPTVPSPPAPKSKP